MTLIKKS